MFSGRHVDDVASTDDLTVPVGALSQEKRNLKVEQEAYMIAFSGAFWGKHHLPAGGKSKGASLEIIEFIKHESVSPRRMKIWLYGEKGSASSRLNFISSESSISNELASSLRRSLNCHCHPIPARSTFSTCSSSQCKL